MTQAQKEQREDALSRNYGHCAVCGESIHKYGTPQYAHRIADTKANRRKWGDWIIDHTLNGEYVCSLKCNDALNCGNNPAKCYELVQRILDAETKRFING
jgi:hypothetical protein